MEPFIKFFRMPEKISHLYVHIKFSSDEMYYLYFTDKEKNNHWTKYYKDVNQIKNSILMPYPEVERWLHERNYLTFLYSKIAEFLSKVEKSHEIKNGLYNKCFFLPCNIMSYDIYGIYIDYHKIIDLDTMHSITIQKLNKTIFAPAHMRDYDMRQYEVKRDEEIMDSFDKPSKEWSKDIKEEFIIPKRQTKTKQPLNIKFSNFKIK